MKRIILTLFLGLGLSTASVMPAAAYPVDCAILLCLAGGWPASAECVHARAVFIARITPWPIEPPLQIWNCPMHASLLPKAPTQVLSNIALRPATSLRMSSKSEVDTFPALIAYQAGVDISGPSYDFVRSIHVYQIEYRAYHDIDGHCRRPAKVQTGTYGLQGEFKWSTSDLGAIPSASKFSPGSSCGNYYWRSILVDWRDSEGAYGFEEVRY